MTYIPYIDVLLHFPILFVMDPDAMHKKAQKWFLNHRTEPNLYHLFCCDYKFSNEVEWQYFEIIIIKRTLIMGNTIILYHTKY